MEPNTSNFHAAWTSSPAAAVLEHGEPASVRDTSLLLSPAFSPAPSPGLVPASGSGSESSWYQQQIQPSSPAVAAGNGSVSVHAHATSSSSSQSEPSSSFPTAAGTLPSVGYDLFGSPEPAAATPLPTLLGGQWQQGESSSVLPECPSPVMFGFAGEFAAWPSEETSCFFSLSSSAGGLAPQSSNNSVGFAQPSLDPEMEAPVLAVEESPVDATLPPLEEDEEIDVSAFLVSDPEEQLPKASWTANPQMAGGGGGASASWMAPASGSTGNNWPPMSAPAAATTCNMVSTNSVSIGVASSMGNMMMPSSPVLPLTPPSSKGAGASGYNLFHAFAQPSSSSVLSPLAPNLRGPLLPVKQEVMDYVDVTERRHPDYISLDDDDDEDGLYQDQDAMFGSWGSSSNSPASFAPPGSWSGSSSGSPSFGPGSWGGGSTSSGPSIAPGSWRNSSGSPSFDGNMPFLDQSMPIGNYRGKMASIPGLPPLPRSCASSRNGIVFTDPEKAVIAKDKKLQELLRTDPKKVKRTLYNRAYSAVAKVRKVMHTKNLERMIVTLEERRKSLREELQSLEEGSATLMAQKMEMQMLIGELEQQTMLKDAVREGLRAQIQNLKHMELN